MMAIKLLFVMFRTANCLCLPTHEVHFASIRPSGVDHSNLKIMITTSELFGTVKSDERGS